MVKKHITARIEAAEDKALDTIVERRFANNRNDAIQMAVRLLCRQKGVEIEA